MKIVTIGGCGFIGHQLSKNLSERGHAVTAIDNHSDYGILDRQELDWLIPARVARMQSVDCIKADVNDHQLIRSLLHDLEPDLIAYLAAFPRAKAVDDNLVLASNTMISSFVNVTEIASQIKSRILFISSSMVYGEWPDYSIDESYEPNPFGMYGILKHAGEKIAGQMLPNQDLLITRLSGVYGPWDATDRVVSRMFKAAMSDSSLIVHGHDTMLDLTYIDDIIPPMVYGIESKIFGTYNLSSGRGTTLFELAEMIKSITSSRSEIVLEDRDPRYVQRGALDCRLANRKLNYRSVTDLKVGLERYYRWLAESNHSH